VRDSGLMVNFLIFARHVIKGIHPTPLHSEYPPS
jgi:hypothetical protein